MDIHWLYIAIFAGISSQLFNFLNRYILKDGESPSAFGWLSEIIRFLVYSLILPFDHTLNFSLNTYYLLILIGIVNLVSVFVFYKMHSYAELSISSIVSRTRLIWVPIIAFIFIGEVLKASQYLGIIILFIGLSITVSPKKIFADKGLTYSFLTSIVVAFLSVIQKALSPVASISLIMVAMSLPTVLFYPLVMKDAKNKIKYVLSYKLKLKILASVANILAMFLTILALKQGGPVSIVSGIYQAMMVISVLAGIIFLNEKKQIGRKIFGSIITLIGVIMLTILK